jgi:hypothetical protein
VAPPKAAARTPAGAPPASARGASPPNSPSAPAANAPAALAAGSAKPGASPSSASASASSNPPTLDLDSLEQRLKDTHAIGVFTKLSLKNQVDDLLDAFRAFHRKQAQKSLSQLRQQYDGLLLKVLSLLQDGDPSLASAIASSREAIWGVLTDPEKFSKI